MSKRTESAEFTVMVMVEDGEGRVILLKGPLSDHKMIFRRLRKLHKNTER